MLQMFKSPNEAMKWLKEVQGNDAQYVSKLSFSDIYFYSKEIDKRFDGKIYKGNEILEIIRNHDAETLQSIHPLFFQNVRMSLSKEEGEFLANHLTTDQLQYLPNRCYSNLFSEDDLDVIIGRVVKEKPELTYCRVCTCKKVNKGDDSQFVVIQEGSLISKLEKKKDYITTNSMNNEKDLKSKALPQSPLVSKEEVLNFLAFTESNLYQFVHSKHLSIVKEGQHVQYQTFELKKTMQEIYVPATGKEMDKFDEQKFFPHDGLIKVQDALPYLDDEDAKSCTETSIKYAIRTGRLSYFKTSEKTYRISVQDLMEYVEWRKTNKSCTSKVKVVQRQSIQWENGLSEEERDDILLNNYITEEDFTKLIFTYFIEKNKPGVGPIATTPRKKMIGYVSVKYMDQYTKKLYIKIDELQKMLDENYGFWNITLEEQVFEKAKPLDLHTMIKSAKKGDLDQGSLFTTNDLMTTLMEKYPQSNYAKIRRLIIVLSNEGQLPTFYLSRRFRYFYLPDVLVNDDVAKALGVVSLTTQ